MLSNHVYELPDNLDPTAHKSSLRGTWKHLYTYLEERRSRSSFFYDLTQLVRFFTNTSQKQSRLTLIDCEDVFPTLLSDVRKALIVSFPDRSKSY